MPRKKKGFQASTNPGNRATYSKTIKLTKDQQDRIDKFKVLKEKTFSNFTRKLIDEHLDFQELYGRSSDYSLNYPDLTCVIGNGINMSDTFSCLYGWLVGKEITEIRIDAKAAAVYGSMMDDLKEDERGSKYFLAESILAMELVRLDYFYSRRTHIVAYDFFKIAYPRIKQEAREISAGMINSLIGMEFLGLINLVKTSPPLRLATYICRKNEFFRTPPEMPEWFDRPEEWLGDLDKPFVPSENEPPKKT